MVIFDSLQNYGKPNSDTIVVLKLTNYLTLGGLLAWKSSILLEPSFPYKFLRPSQPPSPPPIPPPHTQNPVPTTALAVTILGGVRSFFWKVSVTDYEKRQLTFGSVSQGTVRCLFQVLTVEEKTKLFKRSP